MIDTSWMDPIPKKPVDLSWMTPATTQDSGSVVPIGGTVQQDNQADFDFLVKYNQDNKKLRAQDQHWVKQAGLAVGNGLLNMVTGTIEGFGYLPELLDGDHDYSNALTRKMQEWKNPLGEIYRENPNQVFDWKDPAWWFQNIQMLGESAGAFAFQGAAYAKLFGGMARGAATALRAGKTSMQAANAGAQLASGVMLAYTEGAMSGYRIYEDAYKSNKERALLAGLDEDTAEALAVERAGKAAATTVRVNTAMNTLLNVGALATFFKTPTDDVLAFMKGPGAKQAGESTKAWRQRVKDLSMENPELKQALMQRHGWSSMTAETLKEGVEEVNTMYAEAEGNRVAAGKDRDLSAALTDLGQYFDDVTNEEGALNFALGAFGGAAQTVLIDNIPVNRVVKYDPDGNPILKKEDDKIQYDTAGNPKYETQLVSSRTYNQQGVKTYFENIQKAVLADIDSFEKKQQDLVTAIAKGDSAQAEVLRNEIFSIAALDAVSKGITESWQVTYQEIAGLDNTKSLSETLQPQIDELSKTLQRARESGDQKMVDELSQKRLELLTQQADLQDVTEAMQKGFATSMKDNAYKKRSTDAVEDLKHLQKVHDTIQRQYVDSSSPLTGELADHLFFRTSDLYLRKRAIAREEERINEIENLNDTSNLPSDNLVSTQIRKYNEHISIVNDTIDQLEKDVEILEKADIKGDLETILGIVAKYRAKGAFEDDLSRAIRDLHEKLKGKMKLYKTSNEAALNQLQSSLGYQEWSAANPGKSLQDMLDATAENYLLRKDKANLEMVKAQHSIAEENLREVTTQKGLSRITKALAEDRKKMLKAINDRNKQANVDNFLRQQSKEAAVAMDLRSKQAMASRLQDKIVATTATLNAYIKELNEKNLQLKEAQENGIFSNLTKVINLKARITILQGLIYDSRKRLEGYQKQLAELDVKVQDAEIKQTIIQQEELGDEEVLDPNEDVSTEEIDDAISLAEALKGPEEFDPETDKAQSSFTAEDLKRAPEDYGDPVQEFMDLANTLPKEALPILTMLDQLFDKEGTSIQRTVMAFQPLVNRGLMDQMQVNDAFVKLAAYSRSKKEPAPQVPEEAVPEAGAVDNIDSSDLFEELVSLQPEVRSNPVVFTEQNLEDTVWNQRSAKPITAVKVNSSDLLYKTTRNGNILQLRNETKNGAPLIDPKANLDRMIPGKIQVGDQVYLEIDPNPSPDWQINNDYDIQQDEDLEDIRLNDSFNNYIDQNGKIRVGKDEETVGYGNVPIRIVHATSGKVLGYFPRVDWVTATGGSASFRNVTDLFPVDENDDRKPGNVEYQRKLNLRIRKKLAMMYNQDPKAKLLTRVIERTNGVVMYHGDANDTTGKVKYRMLQAKKLLPDSELMFGMATGSGFMLGDGLLADNRIEITEPVTKDTMGMPHVFLPLPNGKYYPSPLSTAKLADRQGDVNTVTKAIEIYLQQGTSFQTKENDNITKTVKEKTGFDISTPEGLSDFIQQYYTHLSNFLDSVTAADAQVINGEPKRQAFKFGISPSKSGKKAYIRVGVTYSGTPVVTAKLKDGALDPKFVHALTSGLNNRFKTVPFTRGNIRGLNDPRPINSVRINKNGSVVSEAFPDFNSYLKSITSTSVFGQMKVEDKYVYAANSQILLDESTLLNEEENIRELVTSTPDDAGSIVPAADQEADLNAAAMDDFENFNPVGDKVRLAIGGTGLPVNLETLEDLYTFTENHNGRDLLEVMQELKELGVNVLAEGHNPFTKCG